jgi:hypothetical protein
VIGINYATDGHDLKAHVICARGAGVKASKAATGQELAPALSRTRAELSKR